MLYVVTHTMEEFKQWQYVTWTSRNAYIKHISTMLMPDRLRGIRFNSSIPKRIIQDPFSAALFRLHPFHGCDEIEFFGTPERGKYAKDVHRALFYARVPESYLRSFEYDIKRWEREEQYYADSRNYLWYSKKYKIEYTLPPRVKGY